MSWAQEEWKDGLNQKALLKITEIENQNEKLKKEAKQKQFQLESLEAAFNKQKQRSEDEKSEISILKRENHSLNETCAKLEIKSDKLSNELRQKETYLNSIEGQLQRCKSQLEQYTCKTPKRVRSDENCNQSKSQNNKKLEEFELLLAQEKAKSKALENELIEAKSNKSSRGQPYKASLPWATDDCMSPVKTNKPAVVDLLTGSPVICGQGDPLVPLVNTNKPLLPISNDLNIEKLNRDLKESNQSCQELEAKFQAEIKEVRSKLVEKERVIGKKTDDITKFQLQLEQANGKVVDNERKLKQIQKELNCERHNAESSRSSLQNKLLEMEKSKKHELSNAQDSLRSMEKQMNESKNKLTQELMQAGNELRKIRTEFDKTNMQRNKLEGDLKRLQQKLLQMEQMHQVDGKKICDIQTSLKEANREKENLNVKLEQTINKVLLLEQKETSLKRDLLTSQNRLTEKSQDFDRVEKELRDLTQKSEKTSKALNNNLENLKLKVTDLENKKLHVDSLLKEKERDISEVTLKLGNTQHNLTDLDQKLDKFQKECSVLSKENSMLIEQSEVTVTQLKKTKGELETFQEKHKSEIAQAAEKLEEEITRWKKKLVASETSSKQEIDSILQKQHSDVEEVKKKIKQKEDCLKDLSIQLEEKTNCFLKVEKELDMTKSLAQKTKEDKNILLDENRKLKEEEKRMNRVVENLKTKLEAAIKDATDVAASQILLEEKHALLVEEARADMIEKKSLEGRVQDLEEQVKYLNGDENSVAFLKSGLESLQTLQKVTQDKLCKAEHQCKKYEEKLTILQEEIVDLKTNLSSISLERDACVKELYELTKSVEIQVANYEAQMEIKSKELINLKQAHCELLIKLEDLSKQLSDAKIFTVTLEKESTETSNTINHLKHLIEQKEMEILNFKSAFSESAAEITSLHNLLTEKVNDCDIFRDKHEQLIKTHDNILSQFQETEDSVKKLNEELASVRTLASNSASEEERCKLLLEEMSAKIDICEKQHLTVIVAKDEEIAKLYQENDSLTVDISTSNQTIEEFVGKNDTLSEEIISLLSKISNLEDALSSERSKYELFAASAEKSLLDAQAGSSEVKLEVESLKLSLEKISNEKDTAHDLADHRLVVVHGLEDDMKTITKEIEDLKQINQDLLQEISSEKQAFDDLVLQISSLEQRQEEKDVVISNSSNQLAVLEQDFGELQLKHEVALKSIEIYQTSLDEANCNINTLQQAMKEKNDEMVLNTNKNKEDKKELQSELVSIEDENENLTTEIAELKIELDQVQAFLQTVTAQKMELERTHEGLGAELNKASGKLELMQMDIEDRDDALKILEQETVPQLQEKIRLLQEEDKKLVESEQALRSGVVKLEKRFESDVLNNAELQQQILEKEEQVQQQDTIIQLLKSESSSVDEKYESLQHEILQLCKEKENFNNTLKEKESLLKETNAIKEAIYLKLENDQKKNSEDVNLLNVELNASRSECVSLGIEINELQTTVEELMSKVENLEILYDQVTQDNSSLREESTNLSREVTTASHALMELEDQLDAAQREVEMARSAKSEMSTFLTDDLDSIQKDKKCLEDDVKRLTEDLNNKDALFENLRSKFDGTEAANLNMKQRIIQLETETNVNMEANETLSNELQGLTSEVDFLKKSLVDRETELSELSHTTSDLLAKRENQLSTLNTNNTTLQEKYDIISAELLNHKDIKALLEASVTDLKAKYDDVSQTLFNSEEKLNALKCELCEKEEAVSDILQENRDLISALKTSDFACEEMKRSTTDCINESTCSLTNAKAELEALRNGISQHDAILAEKEAIINKLNNEAKGYLSKEKHLTEVLDKMQTENHKLVEQTEDLTAQTEKLQANLQQYELKLEENSLQHDKEMKLSRDEFDVLVATLHEEVSKLIKNKDDLQQQINVLNVTSEHNSSELIQTKENFCTLNQKYEALEIYSKSLETESTDLKSSIAENVAVLEQSEDAKVEALNTLANMKSKIQDKEEEIASLKSLLQKENEKFNAELHLLTQELAATNVNIEVRDDDIESLTHELEKVTREGNEQRLCLDKASAETLEMLENLNSSKEACNVLSEKLQFSKHKMDDLQQELCVFKKDSDNKILSLEHHTKVLEEKLSIVQSEYKEVLEKSSATDINLAKAENKLQLNLLEFESTKDNFKYSAEKHLREINDLQSQLKDITEKLNDTNVLLQSKVILIDNLEKENQVKASALEDITVQLEEEKTLHVSEQQNNTACLESAEKQCLSLKNEITKLQENAAVCDKQSHAAKQVLEVEQKHKEELKMQLANAVVMCKDATERNSLLEGQMFLLSEELSHSLSDLKVKEKEIQLVQKDKENLHGELVKVQSTAEECKTNNEILQERIQQMQENYLDADQERHKFENIASNSKDVIQALESKLADSSKERESESVALQEQIQMLEDTLASSQAQHNEEIQKKMKEMNCFTRKIDELQKIFESVSTQLVEQKEENHHLEETVENFIKEIAARDIKLNNLSDKFSLLLTTLQSKEAELSTALNENAHKITVIDGINHKLSCLEEENMRRLKDRDEKIASIKTKNLSLTEKLDDLRHCLSDESDDTQSLCDSLRNIQTVVAKLEDKLSEKKQALEEKTNALVAVEAERKNLANDLKDAEGRINDLAEKLKREDEKLLFQRDFEETLETFKLKLTNTTNELLCSQNMEKDLKDELVMCTEHLEQVTAQLSEAEIKVKNAFMVIDKLQEEQKLHVDQANLSEKEIQQVRHELEMKLFEKQSEVDRLTDVNSSKQDIEIVLKSTEEELAQLREEKESLLYEKSSFNLLISEKSNIITELESDIELNREERQEEIRKLEQGWTQLEQENNKLSEENKTLDEQLELKEKRSVSQKEKIAMLENVILETEQTNAQMSSQLQKLNDLIHQEASNYKKKLRQLTDDNNNMLDGFNKLKDAAKELKIHKDNLERERCETLSKLNQVESENETMRKERSKLEESYKIMEEKCSSLTDELIRTNVSMEDADATIEKMAMQMQDLEQKLKETESLLEETGQAMDALRITLHGEREKVLEQEQSYACAETTSRNKIDSLQQENFHLVDQLRLSESETLHKIEQVRHQLELNYREREVQMKKQSQKVLEDLDVLKQEVQVLEEENTFLKAEISKLKIEYDDAERCHVADKEKSDHHVSMKMQEILSDVEELRSEIEGSENEKSLLRTELERIRKELDTYVHQCENIKDVEKRNKKLSNDIDSLKGKLKLMTLNARRKEKELNRFKESIGGSSDSLAHQENLREQPVQDKEQFQRTHTLASSSASSPGKSRRSKRNSRKSIKAQQHTSPSSKKMSSSKPVRSPLKKSHVTDESSLSASPNYQVEGLPHLVNRGFTDIPHGFSSPFVLRRQQLNKTKQLVAAAMAKQKGDMHNKDHHANELSTESTLSLETDFIQKIDCLSQPEKTMRLRSQSKQVGRSPSKQLPSSGLDSDPLQTVTNSPKHLNPAFHHSSSAGESKQKLRSSRSKLTAHSSHDGEPDCKVQ